MSGNETIVFGHDNWHSLKLEGRTVREIYDENRSVFSLPTDPRVLIDGEEASMDSVVPAGAEVEFVKATGQKG